MSRHNISHADLFTAGAGSAFNLPDEYENALRGMPIYPIAAEEFPVSLEDRDSIAELQQPVLGGQQDIDLNGILVNADGVAILPYTTQVTVVCAGADAGRTFTILGTDANGRPQANEIPGSNAATTSTNKHFLTVDRVFVDADTAGTVTVGLRQDASVGLRMQSITFGVDFDTPAHAGFGLELGPPSLEEGFNPGINDEQTATNGSPRAAYTRSNVNASRIVVMYIPNLAKSGVQPNYTDPSQTPSPF